MKKSGMTALFAMRGSDGKALSRPLLSYAVQTVWGLDLPERACAVGGKPWFPTHPALQFNISHSGGLILCGVGDAPIGVDIELVRPRSTSLPRRILSDREYAWYAARGSWWEDFYTLWTLKESLCKCTGLGLRLPPRALLVPALEPGETGVRDGYAFRAYGGEGWRAATCVAEARATGALTWLTECPAVPP